MEVGSVGVFKKLREFLFGKQAHIFDSEGNVSHNLPQGKWKNWEQRYQGSPDYNWRNHSGKNPKRHEN